MEKLIQILEDLNPEVDYNTCRVFGSFFATYIIILLCYS